MKHDLLKDKFQSELYSFEVKPPQETWQKVQATLHKEPQRKGIIIPLLTGISMAASLIYALFIFQPSEVSSTSTTPLAEASSENNFNSIKNEPVENLPDDQEKVYVKEKLLTPKTSVVEKTPKNISPEPSSISDFSPEDIAITMLEFEKLNHQITPIQILQDDASHNEVVSAKEDVKKTSFWKKLGNQLNTLRLDDNHFVVSRGSNNTTSSWNSDLEYLSDQTAASTYTQSITEIWSSDLNLFFGALLSFSNDWTINTGLSIHREKQQRMDASLSFNNNKNILYTGIPVLVGHNIINKPKFLLGVETGISVNYGFLTTENQRLVTQNISAQSNQEKKGYGFQNGIHLGFRQDFRIQPKWYITVSEKLSNYTILSEHPINARNQQKILPTFHIGLNFQIK